jgi:uncharacterized protein
VAASGRIPSSEPDKLALRLANHWGHKFPVENAGGVTRIELGSGSVELEPQDDVLAVRLSGEDDERLKQVLVAHLERFARGAPVEPAWD